MAGLPGRSTALAISVAAASASAPVRASTVTASAMPSEKERPRQPLVATPRNAIFGADRDPVGHAVAGAGDRQAHRLARADMEGAVAAIVDIGAVELAAGKQRGEHFVGYRTGNGGHRRYEAFRQRHDGRLHAARRRAVKGARRQEKCRQPQFGKLLDQLDQDRLEARDGLRVGRAAFMLGSPKASTIRSIGPWLRCSRLPSCSQCACGPSIIRPRSAQRAAIAPAAARDCRPARPCRGAD